MTRPPLRAAVFASGSGSNFQALLDQEHAGSSSWTTALLVTDRESAGALDRASRAGVSGRVVSYRGRSLDEVAAELSEALDEAGVEVIFLAGFLRLVPEDVVARFRDRILNIHPALLPAFGGEGMWGHHVHEAVLASGARLSGPTVHLVDERFDEGRIVAQWPVQVRSDDTPDSLAARVLAVEHLLYPRAAEHLCSALREGRAPGPLELPQDAFDPHPLTVTLPSRTTLDP